jgi:hypothetical protein
MWAKIMIQLLGRSQIEDNWDLYKDQLKVAFTSSEGALIEVGNNFEKAIKVIRYKLLSDRPTMHLWVECKDLYAGRQGAIDYIVLTLLAQCEFTKRKTLVLVTITKTGDTPKEKLSERYFNAYQAVSKFAKEEGCEGMTCYSDLEYFADMAKETKHYTNVRTRYMFYFPLKD